MFKKDEPGNGSPSPQHSQDPEAYWYANVYQGESVPQLTFRAVIMGFFLGGFMALSNLYVGLKTGWSLGVAITACILSFAIYRSLMTASNGIRTLFRRFPFFRKEMTILENNCMQSTASAAGYSTGGTITSAISAYLIVTGHHIPWHLLAWWTFFLAALGVFMAIPMKRQMINVEQLKFPSGIAAAETLRSLHSAGDEAVSKARALGFAAVFGGLIAWFRDAGWPFKKPPIPDLVGFPGSILGIPMIKWTLCFENSAIMVAAGAIMGWKICWSMLLGAVINYAILAPWMVKLGAIGATHLGYKTIVSWSTWTGATIMVTSSLLSFAFQWKSIARALKGFGSFLKKSSAETQDDLITRTEVPMSWFLSGTIIAGLGCITVLYYGFGTGIIMGIVAVLLTFFLAVVACRVTGESDITPVGAMGKITQLTFGAVAPTNIVTNLMTASVTAGAAGSSADLLTDLKSGYLLGANPRKQFLAQFLGIFAGVLVVVPAFYVIVPNASVLGTTKWPAPSAQVWAAVARLLSNGIESLHPTARIGILVGGLLGIVLVLLERAFPKAAKFIPSPTGLGLAMVIPFFNSLSMFIGALIVLILEKVAPKFGDKYVVPVASGAIAGESLVGVAIALLSASGMIRG